VELIHYSGLIDEKSKNQEGNPTLRGILAMYEESERFTTTEIYKGESVKMR
jgi:hypothetical protein